MILEAIYEILSADTAISSDVVDRIYPIVISQHASYPCLRIFSNARPTNEKSGVSQLDIYSLQVDVYGETMTEVEEIGANVRTALDRQTGSFGGETIDTITFESWADGYEEEKNMYRKIIDFNVRVKL
jgi:hypothetical protein